VSENESALISSPSTHKPVTLKFQHTYFNKPRIQRIHHLRSLIVCTNHRPRTNSNKATIAFVQCNVPLLGATARDDVEAVEVCETGKKGAGDVG
jgi:hypothetical protein